MFFLKILAELFGLMTTIYSFISFNYYSKFRYVENTNPTEEELDLYEKAQLDIQFQSFFFIY